MADAERGWRFVQGAQAASALNHLNIITVHDVDAGGVAFIAMEWVTGRTLGQLMGRKGLELGEAFDVRGADCRCAGDGARGRQTRTQAPTRARARARSIGRAAGSIDQAAPPYSSARTLRNRSRRACGNWASICGVMRPIASMSLR